MQYWNVLLAACGCLVVLVSSEQTLQQQQQQQQQLQLEPMGESLAENDGSQAHSRAKRTLFLKKKLIGAGLLGFGLGAVKGYKFGYHSAPEVHHVIYAPPPPAVKYVEFVEKPVYLEKPAFKPHVEYEPAWSPPEPSPVYGPSW
ncbi:uncharacterized protein LOC131672439 [Phymastichus coffea]|uniref:uncharacterized protein LOC131672439 n=1 Tax=Phymastichus coffea TaxID=108790 RepID=UPI00273C9DCB|nr:uncharacterized protein LOC131672439 [Phymastichus coffea]